MGSTIQEAEIELTDPDFETAKEVGSFVDLATYQRGVGLALGLERWRADTERLLKLVQFLDKYECEKLKDILLMHLRDVLWEENEVLPLQIFLVSAHAGCTMSCRRALLAPDTDWATWGPFKWSQVETTSFTPAIYDSRGKDLGTKRVQAPRPMLDPALMPWSIIKIMPQPHLYALTSAYRNNGAGDRIALAKEFTRQLNRTGEYRALYCTYTYIC
jgi:hypothetical protein